MMAFKTDKKFYYGWNYIKLTNVFLESRKKKAFVNKKHFVCREPTGI